MGCTEQFDVGNIEQIALSKWRGGEGWILELGMEMRVGDKSLCPSVSMHTGSRQPLIKDTLAFLRVLYAVCKGDYTPCLLYRPVDKDSLAVSSECGAHWSHAYVIRSV